MTERVAVAIYARAAVAGSPELAAQVAEGMAWAARHGYRVAGIYPDDGVSGLVRFPARAAGERLLADAETGVFTWVVVRDLERFGRTLPVLLDAQRRLRARGVGIAALREEAGKASPRATAALTLMTTKGSSR